MKPALLSAAALFLFLSSLMAQSYTAHEWGTFTTLQSSNGKKLSGMQRDEEKLPGFVGNLCFCETSQMEKGYILNATIENVTVKMETPVIYFYADAALNIEAHVQFKNGSISEFYPDRSNGEPDPQSSTFIPQVIDFAQPRTGWINWNARILAPNDTSTLTSTRYGWDVTEQWVRPRETKSNLVSVGRLPYHEVEKFLFYRGIGNFDVPVSAEFNDRGALLVRNNFAEPLEYVLVYEKPEGQPATVWWSGAMNAVATKVVQRPAVPATEKVGAAMQQFEDALVRAGLYRDEAVAMLSTWKESYFEHAGLKVFWIAPRSYTDEILPIKLTPQPAALERVIVGRSEVLTPEFEQELMQYSDENFFQALSNDRFYLAYTHLRKEGAPHTWSSIHEDINTNANTFSIFPNPAEKELNISVDLTQQQPVRISIVNTTGHEMYQSNKTVSPGNYIEILDIRTFPAGVYLLRIESAAAKHTTKFVKLQ